ncbi:methylated-DNA--[protein]-cysteine S-methyltransferase [Guggenheimella bovis]
MHKLTIHSPLGPLTIYEESGLITELRYKEDENDPSEVLFEAKKQLSEYFSGERKDFDLPLKIQGTAFEKRVYEELLNIPFGETISYEELATRAGSPRGCRAAGQANGKNKLPIFIPCHRVVAKNGFGGYTGGLDKKHFLIRLEKRSDVVTILDHDLSMLERKDSRLKKLLSKEKPLRVRPTTLFQALLETIVGQQISGKAKDTIMKRIEERGLLKEEDFLNADLTGIGCSQRKIDYIKGIAEAHLDEKNLIMSTDEEIINELTQLKGIGRWSAEMMLIFYFDRGDVLSLLDLGIKKGLERFFPGEDPQDLRMRFSPYNTTLSLYLWG